jgi:hypothetical protein
MPVPSHFSRRGNSSLVLVGLLVVLCEKEPGAMVPKAVAYSQ